MLQVNSSIRNLLMAAAIVTLAACGGGGGGSGGDVGSYAAPAPTPAPEPAPESVLSSDGTWFGTYEDSNGGFHNAIVTIANDGTTIVSVIIDGQDNGISGTITASDSAFLFNVVMNDGNSARLLTDETYEHATFVDVLFNIAILQKGTPTFDVPYAVGDINGEWSGFSIDAAFNAFSVFPDTTLHVLSAECVDLTCTSSYGDITYSEFSLDDVYGVWYGYNEQIDVEVFMSPDKKYAGGWACGANLECGILGMSRK